jgi:hypothetical protein
MGYTEDLQKMEESSPTPAPTEVQSLPDAPTIDRDFGFLPIPRSRRYDPEQPFKFTLLLNVIFGFASTCSECSFSNINFTRLTAVFSAVANLYYCQPLLSKHTRVCRQYWPSTDNLTSSILRIFQRILLKSVQHPYLDSSRVSPSHCSHLTQLHHNPSIQIRNWPPSPRSPRRSPPPPSRPPRLNNSIDVPHTRSGSHPLRRCLHHHILFSWDRHRHSSNPHPACR